MERFAQVAKNVDETKEANKEDKSPWKDLSTAIMEERWVVDKVFKFTFKKLPSN